MPDWVPIEGYRFKVAEEYSGFDYVVEVLIPRQPFASRPEIDKARQEVEGILQGLGRWEDAIAVLKHLHEGVQDEAYSEDAEAIHAEDVEVQVVEREDVFKLYLDIADKSEENLMLRKRFLKDVKVWKSSLENLPRWRRLQKVLSLFLGAGQDSSP